MGKNNSLRNMTPQRKNYKLYKAKKQWITACATFMFMFGATAVITTDAHADVVNNDAEPNAAEETSAAANAGSVSNQVVLKTATPASTASESSAQQSTAPVAAKSSVANSASTTSSSQASATPSSDSTTQASSAATSVAPAKSTAKSTASVQPSSASQKTSATSLSKQSVTSAANSGTKLADQKAAVNDIKPIAYKSDDSAYVSAGYQLTNADATRFLKNSAELEKAGAKITWETIPAAVTNEEVYNDAEGSGNIVVTYKDGNKATVAVSFLYDMQAALNQQDESFYYVQHVGDIVTSMDTPDANDNVLFSADGSNNSLLNISNSVGNGTPEDYKFSLVKPLDTSTRGIHWAEVYVDESNVPGGGETFGNIVGGYTIKVPYIVEGLNLKKGIKTDSNGNPVINAQLASDGSHTTLGFDPTSVDASTLGQYFYQDYDLAYALGVKTEVSGYTAPTDLVNTKTNSFTMTLSGLSNQTAQTVKVNYVQDMPKVDDVYFYNQDSNSKNYIDTSKQNNAYMENMFNGTDSAVNKLGKVTVDGQTYTSTVVEHDPNNTNWYSGEGQHGTWDDVTINVIFGGQNSSGQPDIFSNGAFNVNDKNAGTQAFADSVRNYTNKLYATWGTGDEVDLDTATPATYTDIKTKATALYASENAKNSTIDITNGNSGDALNKALGDLVKNPSASFNTQNSNPILNNNTAWPAGTQFEFINKNNQQVTVLKAGQTYTGNVMVTLPSGTQTLVKDVSFTTKATPLVQDKSVYKGTTLTAKDLVTNADVFPDDTTFQFANNSEPNWNQVGTYNAQITATYNHTQTTSSATVKVTTDPSTAKVTVADRMQFTITYWDDTDNKQIAQFNIADAQNGGSSDFSSINSNYQYSKVTGAKNGVTINANDYAKPSYSWTTAGATNLFGANITIHLTHKLQNITDPSQTQLTRTVTVQYVNGSTGASMASPDKIDVYYTRTVAKDLVTGQTSYSDWTVDTSRGNMGYGTSSKNIVIDDNGTVSVTPPKVAGYAPAEGNKIVIGTNGSLPTPTTVHYFAQLQQVTINFVDDQDNGKSVGSTVVNGLTGQNADFASDLPKNYKLAAGQTSTYTFSTSDNQNITVHLVHQTEETTRTITVNYTKAKVNEDGTYTEDGQAAPSAVLDVCYTTDLVTGKSLWDQSKNDDGYKNGYKVVSGTWTNLPQVWDISTPDKAAKSVVIASVPTLDGYTAYTGGPASNTNGVPANEFVYPAWNGSDGNISDTGKGSIAYTPNAPIYEAQNTHTILYFSNQDLHQTETRTVTRNYKYAETDSSLDGTNVFPSAQLQVFYKRTGTFNSTLNKVVYTDWTWDTSAGDVDTPGFHVISGNWNNSLGSKGKPIGNSPFSVKIWVYFCRCSSKLLLQCIEPF